MSPHHFPTRGGDHVSLQVVPPHVPTRLPSTCREGTRGGETCGEMEGRTSREGKWRGDEWGNGGETCGEVEGTRLGKSTSPRVSPPLPGDTSPLYFPSLHV